MKPLFLAAAFCVTTLAAERKPNILFIFSDDHRNDLLGCVNPLIQTPNLDKLAASSVRFDHAFVTTAICSPSRAACLSGMYGTRNGVTILGAALRFPKATFAHALRKNGYRTIQLGKWHLKTTPSEAGFQDYARIDSNGSWFQRKIDTNLPYVSKNLSGRFYETVMADAAIHWLSDHIATHGDEPFVMWWCNQVPHVDGKYKYPDVNTDPANKGQHLPEGSSGGFRANYDIFSIKIPENWSDDLSTKPPYLATSRFVTLPTEDNYGGPGGYSNPAPGKRNTTLGEDNVQQHQLEYNAAITALDAEIGRVLDRIEDPNGDGDKSDSIADNTWIIFMGDNGWQTGHRKMTSKVLAYEEACRVPLIVKAPGIAARVDHSLVLNIDLTPLLFSLADSEIPRHLDGSNLRELVEKPKTPWRENIYYEAVVPAKTLGAKPHDAIRTKTHKLILTYNTSEAARGGKQDVFQELYDLENDPSEMKNLAKDPASASLLAELKTKLLAEKTRIASSPLPASGN